MSLLQQRGENLDIIIRDWHMLHMYYFISKNSMHPFIGKLKFVPKYN